MPVYKDESKGTYYCKFYYTDFNGQKKQKMKRGFKLQRDAKEWERTFLERLAAQPDMKFSTLADLYLADKKEHAKQSTYRVEEGLINKWLLPVFADCPINDISPADIRNWQGTLKKATTAKNKPLSAGHMLNIVTLLSNMLNFAVRYYGLVSNPCHVAGNTVGKKGHSMKFWTKDDFDRFIASFEESDPYRVAFLTLYYTGVRIGELTALTLEDIDFKEHTLTINKTLHVIDGEQVVTPPKTEKSNRTITLPPFLVDELKAYCGRIYKMQPTDRVFYRSKWAYGGQMKAHIEKAGVEYIRLHDLRHPYVKPTTKNL